MAGWARTVRPQQNNTLVFIELSDGSHFETLQLVCEATLPNFPELLKAGVAFAFRARGTFVPSPGQKQAIELACKDPERDFVKIVGTCDQKAYPLAKKFQKPETLREIAHLRPRTNLISAATRVRNALFMGSHLFFQSRGFLHVATPLITASDCEGAGEMFQVTTALKADTRDIAVEQKVLPKKKKNKKSKKENAEPQGAELANL